jgi:hypothetical protein
MAIARIVIPVIVAKAFSRVVLLLWIICPLTGYGTSGLEFDNASAWPWNLLSVEYLHLIQNLAFAHCFGVPESIGKCVGLSTNFYVGTARAGGKLKSGDRDVFRCVFEQLGQNIGYHTATIELGTYCLDLPSLAFNAIGYVGYGSNSGLDQVCF